MANPRRKLVVNNQQWEIFIGRAFCVCKNTETGKGFRISLFNLVKQHGGMASLDVDSFEKLMHKKSLHVTPAMMAAWIKSIENN